MLTILNRIGVHRDTSGIDSFKNCVNREHFLSYKKNISYRYNSRGFRDQEWPDDLSDVVWCVGDSFTVGIGQPYEETWPNILQKQIGKRCLNLGEDGCSNDTISLRVQEIYKLYKPKFVIVMWSYFSRRRVNGKNVQYDKNHFGDRQDLENFSDNFKVVNNLSTNIVNLLIPNAFIDLNRLKRKYLDYILKSSKLLRDDQVQSINTFEQLDYSRDYSHFDILTSKLVTKIVEKKILELTTYQNNLYNTNIGRIM